MFFSEYYGIDSSVVEHYGAVDISFVCDIPLFIDPMLIFNSEKEEYKKLHEEIIKYFHFLYQKACDGLSNKELKAWFEFNEVPNNWLGYSMSGNKGAALGKQYARFLYKNIRFATNTNNITKSNHIEKIMLLYEGSGKDKISDLTVNLIKGFLCSYTEEFARKYLDKKYIKKFHVEKAYFNYETESFVSKEYELPYITSEKGKKEYVLLTPKDILREDEPAINRKDFLDSYDDVRSMIDNDSLRAYVNNYIGDRNEHKIFELIWRDDKWCEHVEYAFKILIDDDASFYINESAGLLFAKTTDTAILERKKYYLFEKLRESNSEIEKCKKLMYVVVNILPEWKLEYILEFLKVNKKLNDFKKIDLFSSFCSWSGSEIPLIMEKIDFLKLLKDNLKGIDYIDHRKYIEEYRMNLEKYKEKIKLREYIENTDYA